MAKTKNPKTEETDPIKIHFSELGKKSWETRKKKLLAKNKKVDNEKPTWKKSKAVASAGLSS